MTGQRCGDFVRETEAQGEPTAELHVLEVKAIERIVRGIFKEQNGRFLVPWSISNGLSPNLRRHLGINALDSSSLEEILEHNVNTIERADAD